ncbi:hypothetical protein [Aquimarina sp. Aq78]|uniref:hypothetical protein n=1 Tax=Aquimarina sp. Aq78 TaxID=1191889 RepID=UPI00131C7590|nr:hypothetical protein [Aquimarina sp. Aq78]
MGLKTIKSEFLASKKAYWLNGMSKCTYLKKLTDLKEKLKFATLNKLKQELKKMIDQ